MKKLAIAFSLCLSVMLLAWCGNKAEKTPTATDTPTPSVEKTAPSNDTAETGDLVKIYYAGNSDEAWLFDTNIEQVAKDGGLYNEQRPYEPLEFVIGAGMMIPWMEAGVLWMKTWESKSITIAPAEAYGEYRDELVQDLPKENFATAWIDPVVGETYNFGIAQWKVLEIAEETIKLDFNHQLAGQTLTFDVTIEELVKKTNDALADTQQ